MKRIKIFWEYNPSVLQDLVNKWLDEQGSKISCIEHTLTIEIIESNSGLGIDDLTKYIITILYDLR